MKYSSFKTILALTLVFVLIGSFPMEIMAMASDVVVVASQSQNIIIEETLPSEIKLGTSGDKNQDKPDIIVMPQLDKLAGAPPIAPVALGLSNIDSNAPGTLLNFGTEWNLDGNYFIKVDGVYYTTDGSQYSPPVFEQLGKLSVKYDPISGGGSRTLGLYVTVYDQNLEKLHYNYTDLSDPTDPTTRYPYGGVMTNVRTSVDLKYGELFKYSEFSTKFGQPIKDKDFFEINLIYNGIPSLDLNSASTQNQTYTFYYNHEFIEPNVHILKDGIKDTNGAGSTDVNPIYNPDFIRFDSNRVQDSIGTATGTDTDRITANQWIIENGDGTQVTKDIFGRPLVTQGSFAEGEDVFEFDDFHLLPDGLYTAQVVGNSHTKFGTEMKENEKTHFAVAGPLSNIDGESTGSQNHSMPKTEEEFLALYEIDIKNVSFGGKYGRPSANSLLATEVTYNIYTKSGRLVKSGTLGNDDATTDFSQMLKGLTVNEDYIIQVTDTLYLHEAGVFVKSNASHSTYARFFYAGFRMPPDIPVNSGTNIPDISPNLTLKEKTPVVVKPISGSGTALENVNDNPSTGR